LFFLCVCFFFVGTLDYIFLGAVKTDQHASTQPEICRVRTVLNTLDETTAKEFGALPSPKFSSDHIALYCEVEITPNELPLL
jgi:mRNA deadenylase 3'-5' endonuclease subunit Ccr4